MLKLFTVLFSISLFFFLPKMYAQFPAISMELTEFAANNSFALDVPIYIKLTAIGIDNSIDTNYNQTVTASIYSGPGNLKGTSSVSFTKGYAYFTNLKLNVAGWYKLVFSSGTLNPFVSDSFYVYNKINLGGPSAVMDMIFGGSGEQTKASLFYLYALALNSNYEIDTTYQSSITLSVSNSSTLLKGNTSTNFINGVALFYDLSITDIGKFDIIGTSGSLSNNPYAITIIDTAIAQTNCKIATAGDRKNLGIYAASVNDLSFSKKTNRIFASVVAPASLFYSDDSCHTWHTPFPIDSLEYNCGERGWGGSGIKLLTNSIGWIALQTHADEGLLNSSAISFSNGDSGTWKTAMDSYLLSQYGYTDSLVNGIGLSDYYMFSLMGPYITRISNATFNPITDIIDVRNYISGININSRVYSIAIANNSNGYPYYVAIDTLGTNPDLCQLYRYDGTNFSKINLPSTIDGIKNVFTHIGQSIGDTIFISGTKTLNDTAFLFRSYDSGTSWTEIDKGEYLSKVDYSDAWKTIMPQSNGLVLYSGTKAVHISKDLGNFWSPSLNPYSTLNNFDTLFVIAQDTNGGILQSVNGTNGNFVNNGNTGLEAVQVIQIARNASKTIFYVATSAGLAYTTAYLNNSIEPYQKWIPPYGIFVVPISTGGSKLMTSCVAIDPLDSSHVIVGGRLDSVQALNNGGIATTTMGPNGFYNTNAFSSYPLEPIVKDVAFVNSSIALAVSAGITDSQAGLGNIWRSMDGGVTWSIVSPSGFTSGRCIAVGYANNDTVIYVGTGLSTLDKGKLWKSNDLGITWTQVNTGPTSQSGSLLAEIPINDIAIDPRSNDTLYLAAGQNLDYAWVRSTNGGTSYQYINVGGEGAYTSVMVNHNNADSVYAAIRREIFIYDAINNDTALLFRGLPGELIPTLLSGSILVGSTTGFYVINLDPVIDITTDINENKITENRSIIGYPNPSSGEIIFQLNNSEINNNAILCIYNMYGEGLSQTEVKLTDGKLAYNVNQLHLSNGTYLVSLMQNKNSYRFKMTIIK